MKEFSDVIVLIYDTNIFKIKKKLFTYKFDQN